MSITRINEASSAGRPKKAGSAAGTSELRRVSRGVGSSTAPQETNLKLSTFSYDPRSGWSQGKFPNLDSEHTLVIVFAASSYIDHPAALQELVAAYPTSKVIGCSTCGEIAGALVNDASLTVAVMRFENSTVALAAAPIERPAASFAAGEQLARQLLRDDLCGVFVLCDGLQVNGSELVRGLNSILPPEVVITGGLAADGDRFQRTWVIHDGAPQSGMATAAGFYGDSLQITHGAQGGWESFGPERRITRSQGNVLFELDGRPALALYKEYLGDYASELPAAGLFFPLAIRQDAAEAHAVIRTIVAVNEVNQSLTFAGDVPKGYVAQLMRTSLNRLLQGAIAAADQARDSAAIADAMLSVAVSCAGRRLALGERVEEETEIMLDNLPSGTRQIGFYGYGEISPYNSGGADLQNQSMTLTTFSEAGA
jgi:hypothetical protein